MDAQQLRELATNALTGHWPKHLGVNTDAERVEFLARKLESAANDVRDADDLEIRLDAKEKELDAANDEIDNLNAELATFKKKES